MADEKTARLSILCYTCYTQLYALNLLQFHQLSITFYACYTDVILMLYLLSMMVRLEFFQRLIKNIQSVLQHFVVIPDHDRIFKATLAVA